MEMSELRQHLWMVSFVTLLGQAEYGVLLSGGIIVYTF